MREYRILGPVATNALMHFIFDALAISRVVHIDKIDNHKPAHIAQTKLASNFSGGFQIGLEHGFILFGAPFTHAAPTVDIDGNQRFCRINNQITTALEPDFAFGEFFNFGFNAKSVENRPRIAVVFNGLAQLWRNPFEICLNFLVFAFRIDEQAVNILSEQIANEARRQCLFLCGAIWGRCSSYPVFAVVSTLSKVA